MRAAGLRLTRNGAGRRSARKRDAFVIGNVFGELPGRDFGGCAEVILTKQRDHGTAGVASTGVGDDRFETVADLDAVFAFVGSEKEQNS